MSAQRPDPKLEMVLEELRKGYLEACEGGQGASFVASFFEFVAEREKRLAERDAERRRRVLKSLSKARSKGWRVFAAPQGSISRG